MTRLCACSHPGGGPLCCACCMHTFVCAHTRQHNHGTISTRGSPHQQNAIVFFEFSQILKKWNSCVSDEGGRRGGREAEVHPAVDSAAALLYCMCYYTSRGCFTCAVWCHSMCRALDSGGCAGTTVLTLPCADCAVCWGLAV